jgi:hypothetical protein
MNTATTNGLSFFPSSQQEQPVIECSEEVEPNCPRTSKTMTVNGDINLLITHMSPRIELDSQASLPSSSLVATPHVPSTISPVARSRFN